MSNHTSNRWSLEGIFSRGRRGCSTRHGGLLSFIAIVTSLRCRLEFETESVRDSGEQLREGDREGRDKWRERAAMLARNLDEATEGGRSSSRLKAWRRRRAARAFKLREVRWVPVSRVEPRAVYVRIDGLEWLVNVPEVTWNEVRDVSRLVAVGQTVGVKVLSVPAQSKHPFLLLLTE